MTWYRTRDPLTWLLAISWWLFIGASFAGAGALIGLSVAVLASVEAWVGLCAVLFAVAGLVLFAVAGFHGDRNLIYDFDTTRAK